MTHFTGVLEDTRPPSEKLKDFRAEEVVSSYTPVTWKAKQPSEWRKFPIRNQDGSSTCVAQSAAKLLGIDNLLEEGRFVDFSARDIYERRVNKGQGNGEGMVGVDAFDIITKYGATLEQWIPSQNMSEAEIDAHLIRKDSDIELAKIFRAGGYVQLEPTDIEKIAATISAGKGVMLWYRFHYDEWDDEPQVTKPNPDLHHSVVGVDFTIWNGQKAIVIDDSWGQFFGFEGQRVITESFLKQRGTFACHTLDLSNKWDDSMAKPKHTFNTVMQFSQTFTTNPEVVWLQKCLQYAGFFPLGVDTTGYYGGVTAKAVYDYQVSRNVAPLSELNSIVPRGGLCGRKTLAVLNLEFA